MERKTERMLVWGMWLAGLVYILTLEVRRPTRSVVLSVGPLGLLFVVTLIGLYWPAPPRRWAGVACASATFAGSLYLAFRSWRNRHIQDAGFKVLLVFLVIATAIRVFRSLRIAQHLRVLLRRPRRP